MGRKGRIRKPKRRSRHSRTQEDKRNRPFALVQNPVFPNVWHIQSNDWAHRRALTEAECIEKERRIRSIVDGTLTLRERIENA